MTEYIIAPLISCGYTWGGDFLLILHKSKVREKSATTHRGDQLNSKLQALQIICRTHMFDRASFPITTLNIPGTSSGTASPRQAIC